MLSVVNSTPSLVESATSRGPKFKLDRQQLMQLVHQQISTQRETPVNEEPLIINMEIAHQGEYANAIQAASYSYVSPHALEPLHA